MNGFYGSPFADWLERNDMDCFFRQVVVLKGPSFVQVESKRLFGLLGLLGEEYKLHDQALPLNSVSSIS